MITLISPDYDLSAFCSAMLGKHPLEIAEAASAEISYAGHLHRDKTKEAGFRKGSKGRRYCDDLKILLRVMMNGSLPAQPEPEFIEAVSPLMLDVLRKWRIGDLTESQFQPAASLLMSLGDPLCIVVSRQEVESGDTKAVLGTLKKLIASPAAARSMMERVDIAFHGYDQVQTELFEMPKVRDYVHRLDAEFPYWLFFLSKHHLGLQCLIFCFLLPYLTDAAKAETHPKQLGALLSNRWFPAMNEVATFAGLSGEEICGLTDRVEQYIHHGRFKTSEP